MTTGNNDFIRGPFSPPFYDPETGMPRMFNAMFGVVEVPESPNDLAGNSSDTFRVESGLDGELVIPLNDYIITDSAVDVARLRVEEAIDNYTPRPKDSL